MLHHRIAIAALAALFGTAVTGSAVVAGAFHPTAAYADDNQGEQGDHHDNGKHKGWSKHNHGDENNQGDNEGNNRGNRSGLRGTIVGINGATLGVRLNDGRTITVNDQTALNAGNVPNLYVGETIFLRGNYGQDGVYYANRISVAGNNNGGYNNGGYNNGGYNNGGYNNGSCNVNTSGAVTVAGYERGGFNGSSFTLRQPFINGVPIGTDYTILVDGNTCVQRALGSSGEHVTVVGVPQNDGHTLRAIRITG